MSKHHALQRNSKQIPDPAAGYTKPVAYDPFNNKAMEQEIVKLIMTRANLQSGNMSATIHKRT